MENLRCLIGPVSAGGNGEEMRTAMPRRAPWHSILQRVHHNNTRCTEGNNIERRNLRSGTGGKPLCLHCIRLNAAGS